MTEINGKPILLQTLESLEKNWIKETVIVIGYLGQVIIDKFGDQYRNMKLSYIWNRIYDETNSMYSAWLARDYLRKGAILIEGDTVFEEGLLKTLLETDEEAFWALDRFGPEFDGSMSVADAAGRIIDLKIVRGELEEYRQNYFKSTGILKITAEYGKLFKAWLSDEVKAGNVQIYYDLVIEKHLEDVPIFVCDISGKQWMEIDSLEDVKRTEKIFMLTKYVIIVVDGAADEPLLQLGGKTPLEYSNIANMDAIALKGHTGLMRTMYPGLPVGSIVANLGILGYNPLRYYPNGRASFEALGQNIYLADGEIAFRCNLVSLNNSSLKDFTSGNISDAQARAIIEGLEYDREVFKLYPGQSYRNLLIMKNVRCNAGDLKCFEPHMNIGEKIKDILIDGTGPDAKEVAETLNRFMADSIEQIECLNKEMRTRADMLFVWSPSSEPRLPSFHRKYGIDGAIVCGMDFLSGIALATRMENRKISGATGYSDTDIKEKFKAAVNSLRYNDLVFVHINAPDEESHNQNVEGKIQILEKIDKELIGPMRDHLEQTYGPKYRFAILPDHYTLTRNGKHGDHLVPYVISGEGIARDDVSDFSERSISQKSWTIIKSYEFMDFFLNGGN